MCEQTRVLPEFVQPSGRRVDPLDKSSSLWWRLTGPSRHASIRQTEPGEGAYGSVKSLANSLPQVDKAAPPDLCDRPFGMQSGLQQQHRPSCSSLNHAEDRWQTRSLSASPSDALDSPTGTTSPASRSFDSLEEPEVDYSDNEQASNAEAAKAAALPKSSSHEYKHDRESPIYANFPPLPCPPSPPHPSPDEQPLRFLSDHWAEYDAQRIGRKFYYNFHTGQRSWKPPRRRGELPACHERDPANPAPRSASPRVSQRKGPPPLPPAKKKPITQGNLLSSSQDSLLSSSRDSLLSSSREDLLSSSRDSLQQSFTGSRSRPALNHPTSSLPRERDTEEPVQHNGNSKFYFARGSRLATAYQSATDRWYSSAEDPSQVTGERPRLVPTSSIEEETDSCSESNLPWDHRVLPPTAECSSFRGGHYTAPGPTLTPKLNRLKPTPPPVLPLSSAHSDSKHTRAMRTRSMILPEDYPLHGPSVAEAIETFDTLELVTRQGTLNKTELVRAGKKQKKSWSPAYVVLTNRNLFLYKDINSAQEKPAGKSAELQINLAGAVIDWCPDKSKRRNVFQLSTTAGQKVLLQDDNVQTSKEWFDTISAAIKRLPNGLGLVMGWQPEQLPAAPPPEETTPPPSSSFASRRSKKATRSKSIRQPGSPPAPIADVALQPLPQSQTVTSVVDSCSGQSPQERKNRIRDKLRHFFVRRPTLESLQEKGIFKDEPVFGCTLAHLCEKDRSTVPRFVQECILEIERRDMTADGLYRASGNLSQVQKVRCHVNQDDYSVLTLEEDIHVLTGALKMFFRHMKEPLFPYNLFNKFLKAIGQPTRTTKLAMFRDLLTELPRPNYDTLKYLLRHLLRVTEHSDKNRMHIQNLAIVFGPTLLSSGEEPRNLALDMMQQNQVIEFLLLEFSFLFP